MWTLLLLTLLIVLTIILMVMVVRWAQRYLSVSSKASGASTRPRNVVSMPPTAGKKRVFMTNKGPRMYEVDAYGLPVTVGA